MGRPFVAKNEMSNSCEICDVDVLSRYLVSAGFGIL